MPCPRTPYHQLNHNPNRLTAATSSRQPVTAPHPNTPTTTSVI